ncbi:MAG TPA: hypothetical protein VKT54_03335 [Steroidobacteraceae bacterium]|nr:hypothetical protein [Steroidobacteraceae bacterium]
MKILKRLGFSRELLVLIAFAGANLAGVLWDGTHATECTSANAPQIVGCQMIRDAVDADDAGAASGNTLMAGSARHRIRPHGGLDPNPFLLPEPR